MMGIHWYLLIVRKRAGRRREFTVVLTFLFYCFVFISDHLSSSFFSSHLISSLFTVLLLRYTLK
jgi:hypothetical protein